MRHRRVVVVAAAVVLGMTAAVAGGIVYALERGDRPSASRRAADRRCERAYVTTSPRLLEAADRPSIQRAVSTREPSAMAFHPSGLVLIGQRNGVVRRLDDGRLGEEQLLDLREDTFDDGDGGLLALAYDTAGEWLYTFRTSRERDDVVTAYPAPDGIPQQDGERVILTLDHPPSDQHHGGGFAFGPDGALYIGTGDGGGLGDTRGNGQELSTLLGKVLRIHPTPDAEEPYAVPADNPFVASDGARGEIYAYGLRNPFRLAFDSVTGDLWIGDVGQSCWEEIDILPGGGPAGANLGWDRREGSHAFEGGPLDGTVVDPVYSYAHRGGNCAVVIGPPYRGTALPALRGAVLFADFCRGQLFGVRKADGEPVEVLSTGLRIPRPAAILAGLDGEPWVVSLDGDVYRLVP